MANSLLNNISKGISYQFKSLKKNLFNSDYGLSIFSIKYLKHLPSGENIRSIDFKHGKIYYSSAADLYHSLEELFADKIYLQLLKENSYIIDCGSNIGLSAIYLKSICPTATIELFEPDNKNFELLKKNVASCGLQNVVLHNKAIWKGNTILHFKNQGTLASRVDTTAKSEGTKVEAIRLRDLMTREIDFLKMDIEGAEYPVVKDIEDKLYLVKNFFLEYHGKFEENDQLIEMLDIVRKVGFKFYIKEAGFVHRTPFYRPDDGIERVYDVQLNIFCFRN